MEGGGTGKREVNLKKTTKEKKQKQTKNYRRNLPSRSRLVKTNYVNRGVEGSKNLCEAQINTLIKTCRSKIKKKWP